MKTLHFECDENKNEINKKKHGLSFETDESMRNDFLSLEW